MKTLLPTFNQKTLLVFGGAGFIGSNFIRLILSEYPGVRLITVDKLTYSGNLDNLKAVRKDKRFTFLRGDIADKVKVDQVFRRYHPHYVINFAAETHVDRSIHVGALEFIKTNVEGVFNILEAVKQFGGVEKYVQVSTDETFGSLELTSRRIFTEHSAFAPNVPYAATKAGGDLLCRAYAKTFGLPVVVTHCSNNYGPYQYPEKLIPFFVLRMLENKKLPLYGNGKNVRDWIYVDDHAHALALALLRGKAGGVYNIGADNEMNNLDIARLILKKFNRDDSWIEFVRDRPGHDLRYAIDASKIKKELGWRPRCGFVKAFDETVQWYIDNPKWIDNVRKRTGVFNPHIDLWKGHTITRLTKEKK